MIRLVLTVLFVTVFLILSIPIFLIESIIGLFNEHARDISSLRIVQWAFRVVILIGGINVTTIGEENIPKETGVIYVGNHRSFYDIITTYPRCPGLTGYMAKIEILKVPLLSTWMKRLHCLFVDRKDLRSGIRVIQDSIDLLNKGISVCIFPEGTRNTTEDTLLEFKAGAFRAAQKSGAPIVLMAINNSRAALEEHFPKIRPTHIVIEYSEPIDSASIEGGYKGLSAYCKDRLKTMVENNEKLV